MSRVECFMIVRIGVMRLSLRRYVSNSHGQCSGPDGYHNAMAELREVRFEFDANGDYPGTTQHDETDSLWPKKCVCGYEFQDRDTRQVFQEEMWETEDGSWRGSLSEAAPGAMRWEIPSIGEYPGFGRKDRVDSRGHLWVKCPNGDCNWWCIDSIASNGPGWDRSGEPPNVTARPSIAIGKSDEARHYHGFLTNGVLESC
jgi:hypothetical protein